jgi:hypothetical protein
LTTVRLRFAQAFTTEGIKMQDNHTARVEASLNRFELISRYGEPLDWEWARAQLEVWLRSRVDAAMPSVYDSVIPSRGVEHDQPQ